MTVIELPHTAEQLVERMPRLGWRERREAIAQLASMGDAALPALHGVLTGARSDETALAAAVDALVASSGAADALAIELADDPRPGVVCDAAQILGRRHTQSGVPVLARLADHSNGNVTVAAIEALGAIGDRAAVDTLIEALASNNFYRQFPAIDALGRISDVRAIEPLAALLENSALAFEAARALGRFGERAALPPLAALLASPLDALVRIAAAAIDDLYLRYESRYGLIDPLDNTLAASLPANAVRRVSEVMRNADGAELSAIARVLGVAGGDEAIGTLGRIFEGGAESSAARALKRIGRDADGRVLELFKKAEGAKRIPLLPLLVRASLLPELTSCLADSDAALRAAACETLAKIGNPSAATAIFPLLEDSSLLVMQAAIAAIQALGGNETAALAFAAARSPKAPVRRAALSIISYFLPRGALDALLPGVRDSDARVRDAALQGLAGLSDPRALQAIFSACIDDDPRTRASAMRALAQVDEDLRVPDMLEHGLKDRDAWVRYYACKSLGKLGVDRAVQAISALLSDDAAQVRLAAIEALSHIDSPIALDVMRGAAMSNDADMQRAALIGLGMRKRKDSLPLLIEAASSAEPSTRLIAVSAIHELGTEGTVGALANAAADSEESVRNAAIEFLSQRSDGPASRALIALLDRPEVAEAVLQALAKPAEGRIPILFAALERADEDRARTIAATLARMKRPEATHALFHALGVANAAARRAAAITLSALGTTEAMAAVKHNAVEDPDPDVRKLCALLVA